VASRRAAVAAGDAESVAWFVGCVLRASRYPDGFPAGHQAVYRPQTRDLMVDFELPPPRVLPAAQGYRYDEELDAIEPVPRPDGELRERYRRLVACVALRTLHEVFAAVSPEVVTTIMFRGRVATIDRATGRPARPHLLTVTACRSVFAGLVLAEVDPVACLAGLGALVSPSPYDLVPVEPGPVCGAVAPVTPAG
jgi:restriction system protein